MGFLHHEVLGAMAFSDGKSGYARARRGERIETRAVAENVAEVKRVNWRKVVVEPHPELVGVVAQRLGRGEKVGSAVRRGKEAQQGLRNRINRRQLVVGVWLIEKDVKQLMSGVVAEAAAEAFRTQLGKVALPLFDRRYRGQLGFALPVPESLVEAEEECLVPADRAAKG